MNKDFLFFIFTLLLVNIRTVFAKTKNLVLSGPAVVVSYPLMVMAEKQVLKNSVIELSFTCWKKPDQLRAMVIGKQVDFTAMPSNLEAIFYNKGQLLTLMNISILNIMDITSHTRYLVAWHSVFHLPEHFLYQA